MHTIAFWSTVTWLLRKRHWTHIPVILLSTDTDRRNPAARVSHDTDAPENFLKCLKKWEEYNSSCNYLIKWTKNLFFFSGRELIIFNKPPDGGFRGGPSENASGWNIKRGPLIDGDQNAVRLVIYMLHNLGCWHLRWSKDTRNLNIPPLPATPKKIKPMKKIVLSGGTFETSVLFSWTRCYSDLDNFWKFHITLLVPSAPLKISAPQREHLCNSILSISQEMSTFDKNCGRLSTTFFKRKI